MRTIEITNGHWYEDGKGNYLPSVTTILSVYPRGIGFTKWLANAGGEEEANAIRDAAGERGSRIHQAIETLIKNGSLNMDEYCRGLSDAQVVDETKRLQSFVSWYNTEKPEIKWLEQVVLNLEHSYGGRSDCLCVIGGNLTLLDWKTSSAIYESNWCQLEAYSMCLDPQPTHIGILRVGSKHKCGYEFVTMERSPKHWQSFLACQHLWKQENPKAGPKFFEVPSIISL